MCFGFASQLVAQGFRTEYGKNRIQTKNYEWKYFRNETHDVYYYLSGRQLAAFVAQEAESHIREVESFFDFRLEDKLTFVLYNSKLDYNQSNMFLERDAYNVGGTTRIIGNTCFIYYPGNHYDFVKNMRQGIGYVVINEMLYGGNMQERLQNTALLNLPDWYVNGLVNHIALGWDHKIDSRIRNGILSKKLKNMGSLTKENKDLVSHAMWMYIDKRYGREALSNILYVSRVNKSIESGYLYVLGKTLAEIYDEWYDYTYYYYLDQQTAAKGFENQLKIPRRLSRKRDISEFAINANETTLAVASNKVGKMRIHLIDLKTGKPKRIFSEGYKSPIKETDLSYPVFCWDTRENMLHYIYEKDGNPYYIQYNVGEEKATRKEPLTQIQKVYSMSMSPDGRSIAISGLKNGRTDVMVLDKNTVFVRSITNDDYDDMDPVFINNGRNIIFSSNRPDNKFKSIKKFQNNFDYAGSFDLYLYNYKAKANQFVQLTFTNNLNEVKPAVLNDSIITFLHDANGNENLGALKKEKLFNGIRAIRKKKNNLISADDTLFFDTESQYISYLNKQNDSTLANVSKIDTSAIFTDTSYSYNLSSYGENIIKYQLFNSGLYYHIGFQNNRFGIFYSI
ncbi:MAG: TolB family protein [Bacteroidia bacterium]